MFPHTINIYSGGSYNEIHDCENVYLSCEKAEVHVDKKPVTPHDGAPKEASPQPKARNRDSSGEINLSSSQPTLLSRRPEGEGAAGIAVPEVLLTDKARELHARLCEAGMVDERWQPVGLSFTEKGTLIDYVAERLDIRAKWKFFGALWRVDPETLRTSKARGLEQDKTWAFRSRLNAL